MLFWLLITNKIILKIYLEPFSTYSIVLFKSSIYSSKTINHHGDNMIHEFDVDFNAGSEYEIRSKIELLVFYLFNFIGFMDVICV